MEQIRVAFDAQLLFEKQKTGIGWFAKKLTDELLQHPDLECTLNCFCLRDKKSHENILVEYQKKGCRVSCCKWLSARVYNHLERLIPFPYHYVFGNKTEITQFYNYTIPFGVRNEAVTFVYDMTFQVFPETVAARTFRWLDKNLVKYCNRASMILTVSEFSKQEIHKYMQIPLEKIEVVYSGVDQEFYHPNYSPEQVRATMSKYEINSNYLLYLGTLEPRKNIGTLIRAYSKLKQSCPECPQLVLAGKKGWLYDSIFELVKTEQLQDWVHFTGYVDESDVPLLMKGAKLFLFPSVYEGFGMPPLEAMACGTPVITSNAASLPEVVGDAGIMIEPLDVVGLINAIKTLLENEELYQHYSKSGIERAAKFTWKAAAEKMVAIYKKMLNR